MMRQKSTDPASFLRFIKDKEQRTEWLIITIICLIGYIIIKICYPYPATMSDSGTYVNAAATNTFTFYRPFGFSYFLRIVHIFSSSIHAVLISQILLYFIATSTCVFTIKYFYKPVNETLWYILIVVFVFSPTSLYMANAIMSDFLFSIAIYLMIASFIFAIKKQSWTALTFFLVFLFCTLHIRYSAVIFPLLFICFFTITKGKIRWIALASTLIVTFIFYRQIARDMDKTVGMNQFSTGFDGWQMANNGMHVIPFIDPTADDIRNPDMKALHNYIINNKSRILERTENGTEPVAFFMWSNDLPLKQYLFYYIQNSNIPYPVAWVKLGSGLYKDYGIYLIKKHPLEFLQHYYIPNSKYAIYPEKTGLIGSYTSLDIEDIRGWYKIPQGTETAARYPIYKNIVADIIPIGYMMKSIVTLALIIAVLIFYKKLKWADNDKKIVWSIAIFGLLYTFSTVFASPVELRFWTTMGIIHFALIYILSNKLLTLKQKNE